MHIQVQFYSKQNYVLRDNYKICPFTSKVSITFMFYLVKVAGEETVVHRHFLTSCTEVMFRWIRNKQNFAQLRIEHIHGQMSVYINGSRVEIQTPK